MDVKGKSTRGGDPPEQPGVSSQPSDRDADVVVHVEDLLLVRRQFRLGPLHKHTSTHGCVPDTVLR